MKSEVRIEVGIVVVALAALAAFWYLTVYDTATGKCQRGDLGACIVRQAEHPRAPSAPPATNQIPAPGQYNCYAAVPGHDAVVGIFGAPSCSSITDLLSGQGFSSSSNEVIPAGDHLVCSVNGTVWEVEVWDSGLEIYGSDACTALRKAAASAS